MFSITGLAETGTETGLRCPRCGDPCVDPQGHLPTSYNATELLLPGDLVRLYGETNKWARRWRVMKVLKDSKLKSFVDDMGPEDEFSAPVFFIDSLGDDHNFWNTVAECMDIAMERHDVYRDGHNPRNRHGRPQAATSKDWAEEYLAKHEQTRLWDRGITTSAPSLTMQRSSNGW